MPLDVGGRSRPKDLPAAVFVALSEAFFDADGEPMVFPLPDKANTQDDPLDRYIANVLGASLPDDLFVIPSPKKLVSPDVVVARPTEYELMRHGGFDLDEKVIIGLEVKKLELDVTGRVARASGMDYNSTPPSSTVTVIAEDGRSPLKIPGWYLFIVLESPRVGRYKASTMALVSGAALNKDTVLYDRITGVRQKAIGLGSYGDGADRQRPMLVFSNPLGWPWLIGHATLIHDREDLAEEQDITLVRPMVRTVPAGVDERFYCYRRSDHAGEALGEVRDPFPTPQNRKSETSPRGRFVISLDRDVT